MSVKATGRDSKWSLCAAVRRAELLGNGIQPSGRARVIVGADACLLWAVIRMMQGVGRNDVTWRVDRMVGRTKAAGDIRDEVDEFREWSTFPYLHRAANM
jgi:hypothetical protein